MGDEFYRITDPRSSKEITVTHTDVNGNVTQETRNIHESTLVQANEVDIKSAAALAKAAGSNGLVYRTDNGGYTANVFDIPSKVTMDPNTGKINIMAPKDVLNSDEFKKNYGDASVLKQYAAAYRANKDTKINTDDGRQLTIPELVNEWDKGIKTLTADLGKEIAANRDYLADKVDRRAQDFNVNQTRIASSAAIDSEDVKASSKDRQYIPKWLLNTEKGSKIAQLSSWDAASGTVERGDLLSWWNLGNFSRDELMELKGMAQTNIDFGSWSDDDQYDYEDEDGVVRKEDNLSSKTEIAKTISLMRFMAAQDPEGNIFEKIGSTAESVGVNFTMNFAQATTGTLAALETGAAFITDNLDTWKSFTNLDQAMKDSLAYYNEAMAIASDSAVAAGYIAGIGGQILGHITLAKGAKIVAGWAGEAANAARGAINAARIDAATQPLNTVANMLFTGGAVGIEEYATMANSLATGAKALTAALSTTGKLGKVFTQAVAIYRGIQETPLVGTSLSFLADTLIDATISNPESVRAILQHVRTGEVSKEDYNYAMAQFGSNLKGWLVFRSAGLGLKGFLTKTTLGKAANLKISQFLTKLDNWAYDKDQAFKATILGKSVVESLEDKLAKATVNTAQYRRIQNKLNTARNNAVLRQFKETFASGKNWDKVLEQMKKSGRFKADADLKGLKKYISEASAIQSNIKAWNRAIDNMRKGVLIESVKLMDPTLNPLTAATNDAITTWVADYQQIESKIDGLTYDEKHTTMSVESSNYLGYSIAAERETVRSNDTTLSDSVRQQAGKNAEKAQQIVYNLRARLGADAANKLDEALPLYRNEYAALREFAKSPEHAVINSIEQQELEDMDLWGEGYVRTQRTTEDTGFRMSSQTGDRVTRSTVDTQFRNFTDKRDFVDFEQTRAAYRNTIAEAVYQKGLLETYMLNGQSTVKTYISPEETERVRQLIKVKSDYQKQTAEIVGLANAQFKLGSKKAGKKLTDAQYNKTVYGLSFEETQDIIKNYAMWDGNTIVDGYTGADIKDLDADQKAAKWDMFVEERLNKNAKMYLDMHGVVDLDDLDRHVREEGTDFVNGLNQAYIFGDDGLRTSDVMKNIARKTYKNRADMVKDLKLARTKDVLSLYNGTLGNNFGRNVTDGMVNYSNEWIDDVVAKSDEQWAIKKTTQERSSMIGAEEDLTREYTVLEEIKDNATYKEKAYEKIDAELKSRYGGKLTSNEMDKLYDEAHLVFDATLESRVDTTKSTLLENTTNEALRRDVFQEVEELNDKMLQAGSEIGVSVRKKGETSNIIISSDEMGRKVFYQVDPILADIYNRKQQLTHREASGLAKANYAMSKMFRLGTTTANLTSFGNQFFKDTIDGVVVGGMWDTLKNNADNFRDIFGDDVIEQLQAFSPYEAASVAALAETQDISIEEALRKRELRNAELIADSSSEVQAFKEFRETVYGKDEATMDRFREAISEGRTVEEARKIASKANGMSMLNRMDNKVQKAIEAIDNKANGIRERYIRKNVYMSNLNDALSNGYTIKQAREVAEFAARNATTNFGRTLYHLQNISESTPYFASAINGTKSFWRMFELDPVGITGRFMAGLALPAMYLTAQSLSNEQDAKIYKQLPEYEREGSLTFVTNGQLFQIPLPEQLTSLVSPFRHFVEHLHGAKRTAYWKLAANDLLGLSPIDFQGFSSIDMNDMSGDPTAFNMIGRGFSRLFSQVAPVPVKSLYIGATGVDPYTGKQIQSLTNMYYDENSESVQIMDYTQNMFARSVAALFGMDNPKIIEKVTSGIIGNTGVDILGAIVGAFYAMSGEDPYSKEKYSWEKWGNDTIEQVVSRATAPVTGPNYNQVNSMWSQAIRDLSAQKQAILDSKEVKAINDKISLTTDVEERKKLINQRQNYINEFDEKVKTTIDNLINKYGGTFDRHKYGAVLQLLNFSPDNDFAMASSQSADLHSDLFYEGRNQAIQTMVNMGISGVTDNSMFGYYTTNRDGEVVLKYNPPLAILNAQNIWYNRRDVDTAGVKATLETSIPNLSQERSDMWARVKAAKDNKAKDAIREDWNEKVMTGIMPYINNLPTDQIIGNDALVKYLEGYIQVPSWYETTKNRYLSSGYDAKTGTYKLDKNMGFVESYLRSILEKR